MGRGASATFVVLIHPVVVNQEVSLQEFESDTCLNGGFPRGALIPAECAHHTQTRAQSLSPPFTETPHRPHHFTHLLAVAVCA